MPDDVAARAASDHRTGGRASRRRSRRSDVVGGVAAPAPSSGRAGGEERDVPVPVAASDEERLREQALRRARARRARPALPADGAPASGDAAAAHPPRRARPPRRAHRPAPHAARQPAHRRATRSGSRAGAAGSCGAGSCCCCDISGSMEPYARAYLQFLTCAAGSGPNAEAFVFATRLTRITRALASRSPERAIQRAAAAAPDWSSGTRIGDALRAFNDRHGRRGMARGAVIVILSDGWERGDPALVGREMERLAAARVPDRVGQPARGGARASSPRVGGMAAALPHCDALVSGHSLDGAGRGGRRDRGAARRSARSSRRRRSLGAEPTREPWASATPVAGSSVAMPSGYGPSRGGPLRDGPADETDPKTCIYPGCERPAVPAAPARRPAAGVLRPRGAQRADRAPGAPAPRARRATNRRRDG